MALSMLVPTMGLVQWAIYLLPVIPLAVGITLFTIPIQLFLLVEQLR